MNSTQFFIFVFACFALISVSSANPEWDVFEKLKNISKYIRDEDI